MKTTLICLLMSVSMTLLSQEICDNGIDDDGNNLIDLNDTACQCSDIQDLTKNTGSICRSNLRLELDINGAISWQWYKDGVAIVGETNSEIILAEGPDVEGVYVVRIETASGCVTSTPYTLEIPSYFLDLGIEYICDGNCVQFGPFTLCNPGFYQQNLIANDGCDSLIVIELSEFQATFGTHQDTICSGEEFQFFDLTTSVGGMHQATTENHRGCDSIINVTLSVLDQLERVIDAEICEGDTFRYADIEESTTGMYSTVIQNVAGCDSLILVNLDVFLNTSTSITASICNGEVYELHSISETEAGNYTTTIQNAKSCDSIINVTLEVREPTFYSFDQTICEGELFELHTISESTDGTYSTTITNAVGCDSIITVDLSIGGEVFVNRRDTICEGEIFEFNDIVTSFEGQYTTILSNPGVCDSIVTVDLVVGDVVTNAITRSICDGEFFVFNDIVTDQPGFYQTTVSSQFGCDSIIEIELIANANEAVTLTESICIGDTFELRDIVATTSGSYSTMMTTVFGCDSLVMVDLSVLELPTRSFTEKICEGNLIFFDGQEIAEPGDYEFIVDNPDGPCDSLIFLTVETVDTENLISLADELQLNQGDAIDITPSYIDSSVVSIEWVDEFDMILSEEESLFDFTPEKSTFISVIATDENGCSETEYLFVDVDIFVNIYIPNVFSPNDDGVNDRFDIFGNSSVIGIEKLVVFDRWGEKVYEASHEGNLGRYTGWDGNFKGRPTVDGVYSFHAVFNIIDNTQVEKSGSITIMR